MCYVERTRLEYRLQVKLSTEYTFFVLFINRFGGVILEGLAALSVVVGHFYMLFLLAFPICVGLVEGMEVGVGMQVTPILHLNGSIESSLALHAAAHSAFLVRLVLFYNLPLSLRSFFLWLRRSLLLVFE